MKDKPEIPEMHLELVPLPVSDIDRAKKFYSEQVGFKLNVDVKPTENMRVVQLTPPGSACSIVFGSGMQGISDREPGSQKGLHLVVDNIEDARNALIARDVEVNETTNMGGVLFASFKDPDDNLWLLQEFPAEIRQPGQSFFNHT